MTRTASIPGLGTEFNAFLFAPIGEERNGMLLSVVSALARLDLDPWQEAAKLARLPEETAMQRLTSLIETLPNDEPGRDPPTIAARLIRLLPRPASPAVASRMSVQGTSAVRNIPGFVYVIFFLLVLSAQWIAAGHQPSASIDGASLRVSNSNAVATQKERPPSDR